MTEGLGEQTTRTVRLSGRIASRTDPNRELRAKVLSLLFADGWNVYNSNGDQRITLGNVQLKIVECDAFVFMPGAALEDFFKAISILVGYQTLDPFLKHKPALLLNPDGSWDGLFELLDDMQRLGTVHQPYRQYLLQADDPEDLIYRLRVSTVEGVPRVERARIAPEGSTPTTRVLGDGDRGRPRVCVFCSAFIEDASYLIDGYHLGKRIAEANWGCVSGAGTTGAMGSVVRGSVEAGGWTAGSNVPHIIELEGLPEGLIEFWPRPDIYTRMEVMIAESDAFVIFPGGAGTIQEVLALLLFKEVDDPVVRGKPIVLFNRLNPDGKTRFWDRLLRLLGLLSNLDSLLIVDDLEDIVPSLRPLIERGMY
ncbi:MAG: LOG family protein [Puniceicoccaceae bacterium]